VELRWGLRLREVIDRTTRRRKTLLRPLNQLEETVSSKSLPKLLTSHPKMNASLNAHEDNVFQY
jgi:hypothetical protein